jgi:hypothetical protein
MGAGWPQLGLEGVEGWLPRRMSQPSCHSPHVTALMSGDVGKGHLLDLGPIDGRGSGGLESGPSSREAYSHVRSKAANGLIDEEVPSCALRFY